MAKKVFGKCSSAQMNVAYWTLV